MRFPVAFSFSSSSLGCSVRSAAINSVGSVVEGGGGGGARWGGGVSGVPLAARFYPRGFGPGGGGPKPAAPAATAAAAANEAAATAPAALRAPLKGLAQQVPRDPVQAGR